MRKLLLISFLLLSHIFLPAQNKWNLDNNSSYLAFLISDYKSHKLEGGYFSSVKPCSECDKDSLPLTLRYYPPIDFGSILFSYSPTMDTVFYGTIIWAGCGIIKKPNVIIPASSFNIVNDSIPAPLKVEYYNFVPNLTTSVYIPKADSAWNVLKKTDLVKSFSQHPYSIGIYLYTPATGIRSPEGPFWPGSSKWIIFLYRPRTGTGLKVSGKVEYDNSSSTPLEGVSVTLAPGNYSAVTNKNGEFLIDGAVNSTYVLSSSISKNHGGVNATDALLIGRHVARLDTLKGLKLKAADADQSGSVNGWDMPAVLNRITGKSPEWKNQWIFNDTSITIAFNDIRTNIRGICRGDVNASNFLKQAFFVPLNYIPPKVSIEDIRTRPSDTVYAALRGKDLINIGAITLKIRYNTDSLRFIEAAGWNKELSVTFLGDSSGIITIAYANVNSITIKDDILVKLKFVCSSSLMKTSLSFIPEECEIADSAAIPQLISYSNGNITTGVSALNSSIPDKFSLDQNYPNPFNPETIIKYSIQQAVHVKLSVYDMLGKEVSVLVNGYMSSGVHSVQFNADNIPSGIYIYTIQAGTYSDSKKLIVLK